MMVWRYETDHMLAPWCQKEIGLDFRIHLQNVISQSVLCVGVGNEFGILSTYIMSLEFISNCKMGFGGLPPNFNI